MEILIFMNNNVLFLEIRLIKDQSQNFELIELLLINFFKSLN